MKTFVSFPLGYEIRKNTYLRWYTTLRPDFVPVHPEWHPPEIVYKKSLRTARCQNCRTLLVRSKPWTYFKCSHEACGAMYHRHCINLRTRVAIEDGLLDKWVCCGLDCVKEYPYEDANLLLRLHQENQCMVVEPTLTRSRSFTQDMLGPKVITTHTICKLQEANSVCWDQFSWHIQRSAKSSLITKSRHVTEII